jgi:hypothetical protein
LLKKEKPRARFAGHAVFSVIRLWLLNSLPGRPDRSVRQPKVESKQECMAHADYRFDKMARNVKSIFAAG